MEGIVVLLPSVPLLSASAVHLASRGPARHAAYLSVAAGVVTLGVAVYLLGQSLAGIGPIAVTLGRSWGSLLLDPLSALMAVVIAGIGLIVHIYSVRYMAEEPGYTRFFVLLDLMTAALLVMVAAGDLVTLLIAWHLIGVLLYFLLGQDTRSVTSYRYAFWTFITFRFGDLPLVLAAAMLYHAYGTWSLPEIFAGIAVDPGARTLMGLSLVEAVGAMVALSAFARSAQFLLHGWLPYTMAGPTPVSALMHAGIVNAGGFLINRFAPVFVHTGDVLHWVFIVGLVTAVIGSVLMLSQNDVKKALGYSTMGQMGFMVMECGVGAFSLAIYHLIAHGLFKGTLFLGAGGAIGEARDNDGIPKDDLYTFIVERRPAVRRKPWLLMAAITLTVPVSVLILAHLLVAEDFFARQGAVILLFFGWMTGTQLLFAIYRMRAENLWRLISVIVMSFFIVVIGYTLVAHAFDLFLYPDPEFRRQIYQAAGIDLVWFDVLVGLVTLVIIVGWLATYYAERSGERARQRVGRLWINFYALVSREFYVNDLYGWLNRLSLTAAQRLNVWLRWS